MKHPPKPWPTPYGTSDTDPQWIPCLRQRVEALEWKVYALAVRTWFLLFMSLCLMVAVVGLVMEIRSKGSQ